MASTGPVRASGAAHPSRIPDRSSAAFNPFRAQNRNAVAAAPITSVTGFVSGRCATREGRSSTSVSPSARTPRMCFSCDAAIRRPAAVMNPAITGCDRKFARNPSRSTPITSSISPDRIASRIAAPRYSGVPRAATSPTAAAVISDATATGPTASVRDVPNTAYRTSGAMEA